MAFVSGTITGSPTPVQALIQVLRDALDSAGWVFVEEWGDPSVPSNQRALHTVYRNPAANSGLPSDFYISLARVPAPDSNVPTWLWCLLAEQYDPATHTLSKFAPFVDSNYYAQPRTPASDGTCPDTWKLAFPYGQVGYPNSNVLLNTSNIYGTFDYWVRATPGTLTVSTRVAAGSWAVQLGVYDTLVFNPSVNDPMPITATALVGGQSQTPSSATRHPLRGGLLTKNAWGLYVLNNPGYCAWTAPGALTTSTAGGDLYQNGSALGSRIVVGTASLGTPVEVPVYGGIRGLYRDLLWITPGSGAAHGDTIVVGGRTYTLMSNSIGIWVDSTAT